MSPKTLIPVAAMLAAILTNFVAATPARAQTKAALVRDVDHLQPVNGGCVSFTSTSFGPLKCTLYSVPAGKRLVVETVSYFGGFKAGHAPNQIVFGRDNPNYPVLIFPLLNTYAVTPVLAYENSTYRYFGGSQALRIHIDENQSLAASVTEDNGTSNGISQGFSFSGYLIDK